MELTDYNFYTDKYCGTSVPNTGVFQRLLIRSSFFINSITFNRAQIYLTDEVQFATCAVMDAMYKVEQDGGIKSSESVGNHSVAYKGKTTEEKTYFKIAKTYLNHTGLMYRGVDKV
ncbi:MAG: hypothetical protein RR406_04385 [Bacilli bacterium]